MNARIRNIYLTPADARRVAAAPERCGNLEIVRQAQQVLVNLSAEDPDGQDETLTGALRALNEYLSDRWEAPHRILIWDSGDQNLRVEWERIDHVTLRRPRAVFEAMLEHGLLSATGTDGDHFTVEY